MHKKFVPRAVCITCNYWGRSRIFYGTFSLRNNEFLLIWPKEPFWWTIFGNDIKRFGCLLLPSKFRKAENLPVGPAAAARKVQIWCMTLHVSTIFSNSISFPELLGCGKFAESKVLLLWLVVVLHSRFSLLRSSQIKALHYFLKIAMLRPRPNVEYKSRRFN